MDEVLKSEFFFQDHTEELTHKVTQPTEDLILQRNLDLRNNAGAIQDLGAQSGETWGRMLASIPFILWDKAIREGYELNAKDAKHAEKELHRWLMTEDGKRCLVGTQNHRRVQTGRFVGGL